MSDSATRLEGDDTGCNTNSDLIQSVVDVVADVVKRSDIDPHKHLAANGGDSLDAVHVSYQLEQIHGVTIPLQVLFDAETLIAVAHFIQCAKAR
jgi:acyl carrier protein